MKVLTLARLPQYVQLSRLIRLCWLGSGHHPLKHTQAAWSSISHLDWLCLGHPTRLSVQNQGDPPRLSLYVLSQDLPRWFSIFLGEPWSSLVSHHFPWWARIFHYESWVRIFSDESEPLLVSQGLPRIAWRLVRKLEYHIEEENSCWTPQWGPFCSTSCSALSAGQQGHLSSCWAPHCQHKFTSNVILIGCLSLILPKQTSHKFWGVNSGKLYLAHTGWPSSQVHITNH